MDFSRSEPVGSRFLKCHGLSDICVTLRDGTEIDCLQKIYPVGRYIAAAFAGDVETGFEMIDALRRMADLKDERLSCNPHSISGEWPPVARQIFAQAPTENQENTCATMVISAHPQEHTGNPAHPRSHVHIFRSPNFEAEAVAVHKLGSIGSGSQFGPFRDAIEQYSNDYKRREIFMQGEVGTPGGMGTMLGSSLTDILLRTEPRWVSSHLHYCWVYRGRIIVKTNDHRRKGRWSLIDHGSGVNADPADAAIQSSHRDPDALHFEMPQVATSWDELQTMLSAMGATAAGCRA